MSYIYHKDISPLMLLIIKWNIAHYKHILHWSIWHIVPLEDGLVSLARYCRASFVGVGMTTMVHASSSLPSSLWCDILTMIYNIVANTFLVRTIIWTRSSISITLDIRVSSYFGHFAIIYFRNSFCTGRPRIVVHYDHVMFSSYSKKINKLIESSELRGVILQSILLGQYKCRSREGRGSLLY